MNFINKDTNVENVLLVDGVTRAGKFFLAEILSGFDKVEFFQYLPLLEQIPVIYGMGKIEEDAAISLMKSTIDYGVYDRCLGRNYNNRVSDMSSIYNSTNLDLYLKRQFTDCDDEQINNFMHHSGIKFLFVTHNVLANLNIFFKAYPLLSVVHIVRDPVDLVYSWNRKGYGERSVQCEPQIDNDGVAVPWYSGAWKENYEKFMPIDRIIKDVKTLNDLISKEISKLSEENKSKILIIKYEDFVMNTDSIIHMISDFLNVSVVEDIREILIKKRLPNSKIMEDHNKKSNFIYDQASDECIVLLKEMENNYVNTDMVYAGF